VSEGRFKRLVRAGATLDECGGSFNGMLRKFRFRVGKAGILSDIKRAATYEKPSTRRRTKGMQNGRRREE
jgi:ribosomal protein S21